MKDSEAQTSPGAKGENLPTAGDPVQHALVAPVWHTVVIVAAILLNSYASRASQTPVTVSRQERLFTYGVTFLIQLALVLFIWFGITRKGVRMRDLVGGRWARPTDAFLDFGIAIGFWLISTILRSAIAIAFHLIDIHDPQGQLNRIKQATAPVGPQSGLELGSFLVLVIFAGIFEEIIFRGYLQRQFGALAKNIWAGVLLSAVVFGAGHGYQGTRFMVLIGIYGAMFGVLAVLRKSLRPGMIAHAGQDAFSGIAIFVMTKSGIS
jgi:uncharacterized protein